jgi:HSP20 family molecular chaperone IbpA
VASKLILGSLIGDEFERTFNELFEDILITRWRPPARVRNFGDALVTEDQEVYRLKIALPEVDPQKLEVEVSEWRLVVRLPAGRGHQERTFDFAHRVEIERVSARFEAGTLEITLPKTSGRKIEVQ